MKDENPSSEIRPRYLSLKAAAQYLTISPQTLLRLVAAGKLPAPKYLSPKLPRWDRDAIDAAMCNKPSAPDWYAAIDADFEKHRKPKSRK